MLKNSGILLTILTTASIQAGISIPTTLQNVQEKPEEFVREVDMCGSPAEWLKRQDFFVWQEKDTMKALVDDIIPHKVKKIVDLTSNNVAGTILSWELWAILGIIAIYSNKPKGLIDMGRSDYALLALAYAPWIYAIWYTSKVNAAHNKAHAYLQEIQSLLTNHLALQVMG